MLKSAYFCADISKSRTIELMFFGVFPTNCEQVNTYVRPVNHHQDDGLAVFRNVSGPHCEKIKKDFQKLFQQHGLKLIIKFNLKIVDLPDVTLNLTDSTDEIC